MNIRSTSGPVPASIKPGTDRQRGANGGNFYWADSYVQKRCTAEDAIGLIRPGQRVFIGSSCGEPQHLVKTLADASAWFTDLEIVRLLSLESTPLTLIANKTQDQSLNIRSFYLGSAKSQAPGQNKPRFSPR